MVSDIDLSLLDFVRNRRVPSVSNPNMKVAGMLPAQAKRIATQQQIMNALAAGNQALDLYKYEPPQVSKVKPLSTEGEISDAPDEHAHPTPVGENGRLDPRSLVNIGGSHALIPPAAEAWNRMKDDAAKSGVNLTVTDSYRTYDEQVRLANEKGLYSKGGLAATPGTSNHGLGKALDVGKGKQREWLAKNAHRYGFKTIPREPWHWEWVGG